MCESVIGYKQYIFKKHHKLTPGYERADCTLCGHKQICLVPAHHDTAAIRRSQVSCFACLQNVLHTDFTTYHA